MLLDPSCCSIPSLQQRAPPDSPSTNPVLPSLSNLFTDGPVNAGPSPLLSHSSVTSTTTPSQPTNGTSYSPTSSQPFTTSSPMPSQANPYPSNAGNAYLQQASTTDNGSQPSSISLSSSSSNSETTGASTGPSSSTPLYSSLWPTSNSSSSGSLSTMASSPGFVPYPTISPIPLPSSSSSALTAYTTAVVETSTSIDYSLSADPSDTATASASSPSISASMSTITPFPTTLIISTTKIDTYTDSAPSPSAPYTSTLILTSVLSAHPSTAWTTTTSGVLSTTIVNTTGDRLSRSPGSIAGMILGVLGAIAFAILWLFCARRRQRKLSREFEANAIPPWAPGGPLKTEVDMEERYAGILEALNAGMGAGRNVRIDDSGEVSVLGEGEAGAGEGATRASSPMLPGEDLDIDGPHVFPLSPPPPHPPHTPHPSASSSAYGYGYGYTAPPPPSAYIPHASSGARRRSSPGPDASAWFGGYTVAPAPSATSNYSHSSAHFLTRNDTGTLTRTHTESGTLTRTHTESGTLSRTETGTRTRTGSEEPLLTRAGSGSEFGYGGGRDGRLGSAFGSYEGSVNGCGLAPTSPSLSASGHGFATSPSSGVSGHGYGLAASPSPSRTASSFDVLRSISSKGALRSMDSHGYGFGYGFGSASSAGTGSYRGPGLGLAIAPTSFSSDGRSGVKSTATSGFSSDAPPTSFSDRRTGIKSDRKGWKKGKRERESMGSCSTASASGSVDGHGGVRAFFGRLRRGNTPSPKPSSGRDVESEGWDEKSAGAGAKEVFSAFVSPATPEPVFGAFATPAPESAPLPTTPRFVLSNPDPRPSSPYIGDGHGLWPWVTVESPSAPGPATATALGDELHLTTADGLRLATTDGLLDPRLRDPVEGRSNSSLRDFEDYSRPIGGLINNRMQSTTTFGTVDTQDFDDGAGEDVPRASWVIDGGVQ